MQALTMQQGEKTTSLDFFFQGKFISKWLGDHILFTEKFLFFTDEKSLWWFNGKYYEDGEAPLAKIVKNILGIDFNAHRLKETQTYINICVQTKREEKSLPLNLIPLKNGLFDWQKKELLPFNHEFFLTATHEIEYDPNAVCPEIETFLTQICPENEKVILELFGYSFLRSAKYETASIFYGTGGNGKSVLLMLLRAMHGGKNTSHATLQQLCNNDDKFAAADLYLKTVNICDELPAHGVEDTTIFKAIVSGNPIRAQRKGQDAFDFEPFAKLFFSTNAFPRTKDMSKAYWRRWVLLEFPNQFEDGAGADKCLLEKLISPTMLSGLFNLSIMGLKEMVERGYIYRSKKMEETREVWITQSDPLTIFLEKQIVLDLEATTPKAELYPKYVAFCVENDGKPLSEPYFFRNFKTKFPRLVEVRRKSGTRKLPSEIKGIRFLVEKDEEEEGQGRGQGSENLLVPFVETACPPVIKLGSYIEKEVKTEKFINRGQATQAYLGGSEKLNEVLEKGKNIPVLPVPSEIAVNRQKTSGVSKTNLFNDLLLFVGGNLTSTIRFEEFAAWPQVVEVGLDKELDKSGYFEVDAQNCVRLSKYGSEMFFALKSSKCNEN